MKHSYVYGQEDSTHKDWGLKWMETQTCIIHSELETAHPYQLCPFLLLPVFITFAFLTTGEDNQLPGENTGPKTGMLCVEMLSVSGVRCLILISMSLPVLSIKWEIFCLCRIRKILPQILTSAEHQSVLAKFAPTFKRGGAVQKSFRAVQLVEITTTGNS